jgi:DNA-binding transcriptional regulator YbjK
MKSNSMSRIMLSVVLSISLIGTGCSAQWISVALADLPVLTQMALNLAALAATLQTGKQLDPAQATAIQNISTEASKDLTLMQSLYSQYKASPNADTLQKITGLIQETSQSLPALLQAAHVSDPALSARITAAVNLILTTVGSFASLIPQTASSSAVAHTSRRNAVVASPQDLKKQWNLQVCAPSGNPALDAALSERTLR